MQEHQPTSPAQTSAGNAEAKPKEAWSTVFWLGTFALGEIAAGLYLDRLPLPPWVFITAGVGFGVCALAAFAGTSEARRAWWNYHVRDPWLAFGGAAGVVLWTVFKIAFWLVLAVVVAWMGTSLYEAMSLKALTAIAVVLLLVLVFRR